MSAELLADLARAKAVFQLRAISAVLGLPQGDRSPQGGDGLSGSVHESAGPVRDAPNPTTEAI